MLFYRFFAVSLFSPSKSSLYIYIKEEKRIKICHNTFRAFCTKNDLHTASHPPFGAQKIFFTFFQKPLAFLAKYDIIYGYG